MREPTTQWFFQPRPTGHGARSRHDDPVPGLMSLPAAMLLRHGARVLDPGTAVAVDGYPPPEPTVYRAKTLLVPGDLHGQQPFRSFNKVLGRIGVSLVPSAPSRGRHNGQDVLPQLPRAAMLVPAKGSDRPGDVDAWVALQALRAAARGGQQTGSLTSRRSTGSRWSICWSARPSPGARPSGGGGIAGARPQQAAPGPPPLTPTCSAAATRAPRSRSCSIRPRAGRPPTCAAGTAGARWSPSWTRASAPIRGWTWARIRGAVTPRPR